VEVVKNINNVMENSYQGIIAKKSVSIIFGTDFFCKRIVYESPS